MNLPEHDDLHLLAAAYALDALDALDRARFEQHLSACPTCQHEVRGFSDTAALLAQAVATPPPDSLRKSVLAQVAQTPQVPYPKPAQVRGQRRMAILGIAATAVVAAGALSFGVSQQVRANQRTAAIATITQASDAKVSLLSGSSGTIQVTYSATMQASVLVADGLPSAPSGRVYELWLINASTPKRSITFKPNGKRHAAVKFDGTPAPGTVFAITEEPAGGSDAPTTPPTHVSEPI